MEIPAIYENGVARPLTPLTLPESTLVNIVVPNPPAQANGPPLESSDGMDEIYEILGRSYDTGIPDLAERHNEHQP
jgi:predicted DNA-binding antitoxin AbrB/MazE fold protein